MALKIRLRRQGRTNRPFYRLVVAEGNSRRDGKYLESVGWYDPFKEDGPQNLLLKPERIEHWVGQGAILSENAVNLMAKAAPDVLQRLNAKTQAARVKVREQRKARNAKAEG